MQNHRYLQKWTDCNTGSDCVEVSTFSPYLFPLESEGSTVSDLPALGGCYPACNIPSSNWSESYRTCFDSGVRCLPGTTTQASSIQAKVCTNLWRRSTDVGEDEELSWNTGEGIPSLTVGHSYLGEDDHERHFGREMRTGIDTIRWPVLSPLWFFYVDSSLSVVTWGFL